MRDIAKLAKLSIGTVSLALRKHSSIPASTREKIEEIARQIEYRPDPALSALMVYRRGAKPSGYQGTIAWINTHLRPEFSHGGPPYSLYFQGAQERCAELGYRLEEFRLIDLDMNFERLSKILYFRNIQGLILLPQNRPQAHISSLSFAWERFSAIALGFTLARPQLHVVTNAQYRSARLAVRKLRSLGYRRIGCINSENLNKGTDSNFLGGFLVEQCRFPTEDHIPIFTMSKDRDTLPECRKWCDLHQPDAIFDLSLWATYSRRLLESAPHLKFGIASIDQENLSELAGIRQNSYLIGQVAVDEVVALILSNKRGIPEIPRRILVEGSWVDGPSAPRIRGKAASKQL